MPHKRENYLEWEEYFMSIAFLSAQRSKDPRTQVGACIVNHQNKIVGIGYNGMPVGCSDDKMPWNRFDKSNENWLESKSPYVCHAELNAVLNKNLADVTGCKIYVALFPCNTCAQIIVQSGIQEVIFYSDKYHDQPHMIASRRLLNMAGVKYRQFRPRQKKVVIDFELIESTPAPDGSLMPSANGGAVTSSNDGDASNSNKGVERRSSFTNHAEEMNLPQNLRQVLLDRQSSLSLIRFESWNFSLVLSLMFVAVAVLFTWVGFQLS